MRFGTFTKVMGLVVLTVVTASVTSSIMGQSRPRKTNRAVQKNATTVVREVSSLESSRKPDDGIRAEPAPLTAEMLRDTVSRFTVRQMSAAAVGRQVSVFAKIDILDKRTDVRYLWGLRVSTVATVPQVVSEKLYHEQIFAKPDLQLSPTFSEQVELPPGTYNFRVVLFAIPPVFDLTTLEDETVEDAYKTVGASKRVTVTD